jgi:hypothetical protein
MSPIESWEKLQVVYDLAKECAVGFNLCYCEGDDSWYFSINSIAKSEEWIGKNRGFDSAVENVTSWLKKIKSGDIP